MHISQNRLFFFCGYRSSLEENQLEWMTSRDCLQMGHVARSSSHWSMHATWKIWPHAGSNRRTSTDSWKSWRQIAQQHVIFSCRASEAGLPEYIVMGHASNVARRTPPVAASSAPLCIIPTGSPFVFIREAMPATLNWITVNPKNIGRSHRNIANKIKTESRNMIPNNTSEAMCIWVEAELPTPFAVESLLRVFIVDEFLYFNSDSGSARSAKLKLFSSPLKGQKGIVEYRNL